MPTSSFPPAPMPGPPPDQTLFTAPAFLDALEASGCVGADTGWTPAHLLTAQGRVPCYEKAHSWGEFVFDFELARAYQARGLPYYPKLVGCVPFTPVPGARLLGASDAQRLALAEALRARAGEGYSGAHLLFISAAESRLLEPAGWLLRDQLRYVWHAGAGRCFDDYLGALNSKRRKNVRAERRKLAAFEIRWQAADTLDADEWQRVFRLYASTYLIRGQRPYLNLDCLQRWARAHGPRMQFCLARQRDRIVAMAFFFEDGDTLYGRHWGADEHYDALHFELCYYQGMERCYAQGLHRFDAGVQGEHKLARGFAAELAQSAHWFGHRPLHQAIGVAFMQERHHLAAHLRELHGGDTPVQDTPITAD